MFRVTRPYLNLLLKPGIFFRFSGKNKILCILKGGMPFKMHEIIFFPEKKIIKKNYVCLPYLKFSDLLPETHFFRPYAHSVDQLTRSESHVTQTLIFCECYLLFNPTRLLPARKDLLWDYPLVNNSILEINLTERQKNRAWFWSVCPYCVMKKWFWKDKKHTRNSR